MKLVTYKMHNVRTHSKGIIECEIECPEIDKYEISEIDKAFSEAGIIRKEDKIRWLNSMFALGMLKEQRQRALSV